jgi:hypothetical protein
MHATVEKRAPVRPAKPKHSSCGTASTHRVNRVRGTGAGEKRGEGGRTETTNCATGNEEEGRTTITMNSEHPPEQ